MIYPKGTILQRIEYNVIVGLGSLVRVVDDTTNVSSYSKVIILKGVGMRNRYKNGDTVIVDVSDFKPAKLIKRKQL
jgi:hypothetical protein